MERWKSRHPHEGSELQDGKMKLSTTDQRDRNCGWVWHVHADDYSDQMACGGHLATEEEAKAAAERFARSYAEDILAALTQAEPA